MKHDFLKIDTTTKDPLELALWNAYEYEYDARLASRFKWEDDRRDYTTAFNTSFTLLLNNKGMVVLRDMLRKVELYCIRKNAAVLQLMLCDLLGDKFKELQLEKGQQEELTLRAQEVLENLFKDRYVRIYDQLCTLAITSHLYSSGYEFYTRDLATKLLHRNSPKTASHLILMLAASGRVNAQLLLLQTPYDPIDPTDSDDKSHANIMSAVNYRLANYLVDSATDNYLSELQSTTLAESQASQPVLSLVDQTTSPPHHQLREIVAPRPEPPRLIPSVERATEETIALIPTTIDERIIQHESTELSELRTKAELLEAQLKEAERQLAATTHDLHLQQKAARHQKYLNSILNQQLAQKETLRADSSNFPIDVTVRCDSTKRQSADPIHDLLNQVVAAKLTPAESLTTIDKLLTNHVAILPSAYKSAKESENFRDRKGCFKLLWRLATDYRTALLTGSGDAEARKVFSYNEFASNDGEAEDRRKSQLRFEYNGRILQFSKHLKLGFKKSNAETIRIYFDYDALEQKIIIAYCGPHL